LNTSHNKSRVLKFRNKEFNSAHTANSFCTRNTNTTLFHLPAPKKIVGSKERGKKKGTDHIIAWVAGQYLRDTEVLHEFH